ncbi:MAG: type IV secretion system DNA-binding domain-containing protein [Alphaproteobacteria bacterium]
MAWRNRSNDRGRFIGPFGRGFGVLWNRTGHRFRAYGIGALALFACWITIVPGFLWIVEPTYSLIGAARWATAALLDLVGLHDWRWTVDTVDGVQRWRSEFIRFDAWHLVQVDAVVASLWNGMKVATGITFMLGMAGFAWLQKKGRAAGGSRVLRGRPITSDRNLAATLRRERRASDLSIGRVPLIREKEPYGMLLLGAQGTGKTSATEAILEGVEARGEPAVIYDYGPGLMPRFFKAERGDVILNPLDDRSAIWSPWSEIQSVADCAAVAESFIPNANERDPFWGDAGRLLYAEVLERLRTDPDRSVEKLLHILLRMTQVEMREILAGTNAAKLFDEGAERTGKSVEIHNSIYIKALGLLEANAGRTSDFSIYDYVQALDSPAPDQGRPWLWLTTDPRSSPTLKPLLSCWVNAVATALLSLPERLDRRLWFILDELATLHALPSLPPFMQNARKRGGCALITLQTPSQLKAIYRDADAQTILNGCQTQAIFRVSDAEGSEWASRSIGHAEVEEMRESTRLSSHGRRGHEVQLSVDKRIGPVVMPAEIAMTPDCRCYLKLPGDRPIALTTVKPRSPMSETDLTPGFVRRRHDTGTAGAALALASSTTVLPPSAPPASLEPKTRHDKQTKRQSQPHKKEKSRPDKAATIDMFHGDKAGSKPGSRPANGQALGKAVWE